MKPHTPTKAQLYERIAHLEKENARLIAERDAAKVHEWNRRIGEAKELCAKHLSYVFPNTVSCITFSRVDSTGYWFLYRITLDDNIENTYVVRHSDLDNPIKEV